LPKFCGKEILKKTSVFTNIQPKNDLRPTFFGVFTVKGWPQDRTEQEKN
jgi:hypothetical protein